MAALELYQFLRRAGVLNPRLDHEEVCRLLSNRNIVQLGDLCSEISRQLVAETDPTDAVSPFVFFGNSMLGGGSDECINPDCRLATVDEVGRFAALYADKIYLVDPFRSLGQIEKDNLSESISEIAHYITVLAHLEPLVAQNLISYVPHSRLCQDCFARALGQTKNQYSKNLKAITSYLERRYTDELSYSYGNFEKDLPPYMKVRGPEDLLRHGESEFVFHKPLDIPNRDERIIPLSKKFVKDRRLFAPFVGPVLSNLLSQSYHATQRRFSYLTGRQVEFDVIDRLAPVSNQVSKRPRSKSRGPDVFSHSLPFVQNTSIKRLVDLREAEPAAFSVYRDTLSKSLAKAQKLPAAQRAELFYDVVQPEINKIEFAIRKSRKILYQSITQDLTLAIGSVAIGLFSGLMPPTVGAAVAGLGGAHYSGQFLKNFSKLFVEPPDAVRNPYYFLWKARKRG